MTALGVTKRVGIWAGLLVCGFGMVSCASLTPGMTKPNLVRLAQKSSCENPIIQKHVYGSQARKLALSADITDEDRIARVMVMGFTDVKAQSDTICADAGVSNYRVSVLDKDTDVNSSHTLYVKHMTSAAIKADPTVKCSPTFTQIYQPALKLGGSGRVIMVPKGEKCGVKI